MMQLDALSIWENESEIYANIGLGSKKDWQNFRTDPNEQKTWMLVQSDIEK